MMKFVELLPNGAIMWYDKEKIWRKDMNGMYWILICVMTILLYCSAVMKIKLGEIKNQPYSTGWKVQLFIFPVMMTVVLGLLYFAVTDLVLPVIFLGIIEEFICWCIRKKQSK